MLEESTICRMLVRLGFAESWPDQEICRCSFPDLCDRRLEARTTPEIL